MRVDHLFLLVVLWYRSSRINHAKSPEIAEIASREYLDKSTKDLKRLLDEYKNSEIDLLKFDAKKRDRAGDAGSLVVKVAEYLKMMKTRDDLLYTMDNAIDDLEKAAEILKDVYQKYDYSKLPKKD